MAAFGAHVETIPQKIFIWKTTLTGLEKTIKILQQQIPINAVAINVAQLVAIIIKEKIRALKEYQDQLDNLI